MQKSISQNSFVFPYVFTNYFTVELLQGFVFGAVIILAVWFSADEFKGIIRLIPALGMSIGQCSMMLILALPRICAENLPIAIFVGVFLIFRRWRNDNEFLVLRICGISVFRIITIPIFIGMVATFIHFVLIEYIEPIAVSQFQNQLNVAVWRSQTPSGMIKNTTFESRKNKYSKDVFILVRDKLNKLENAYVLKFDKDTIRILVADTVSTHPNSWQFENGHLYDFTDKESKFRLHSFESLKHPSSNDYESLYRPVSEQIRYMNIKQLIAGLQNHEIVSKHNRYWYYLNRKLALPLACILFVLAVFPVTVTGTVRTKFYVEGLYVAFAITGFYVLQSLSVALSDRAVVNPGFAAWLPDIFLSAFVLGAAWIVSRAVSLVNKQFGICAVLST